MFDESALRSDLLSLMPIEFYMKHIIKSKNWYFSNYLNIPHTEILDKMDYFKEIVSSALEINFHSLQMVGSAKTGYSLSPNKIFRPFHCEVGEEESSDIDIAIVSSRLYGEYWYKLRHQKQVYYDTVYYNRLATSIYKGFINEKDLLKINGVKNDWESKVQPLNIRLQDRLGFVHPVTYRIYRSWEDLEDYQIYSIKKAKKMMEGR